MKTGISVDQRIRAAVQSGLRLPTGVEPHLAGALKQTLSHPGNLVRARLVYQVAAVYGVPEQPAMDLAVAIEFFHTASLLFDDLPFMDDARERRGSVCAHRMYGEAAAVLAALALINRAYGLLWQSLDWASPACRIRATAMVESCLGLHGILNGQSQDLHFEPTQPTGRHVMRVAMGKTVSLIRLTLVLPALLGGASRADLNLLRRLAVVWGLSYQMLDDMKDLFGSAMLSGKTSQRDASLHRPNLALVEGAVPALRRLGRLINLGDTALGRLAGGALRWQFLGELRSRLAAEFDQFTRLAAHPSA